MRRWGVVAIYYGTKYLFAKFTRHGEVKPQHRYYTFTSSWRRERRLHRQPGHEKPSSAKRRLQERSSASWHSIDDQSVMGDIKTRGRDAYRVSIAGGGGNDRSPGSSGGSLFRVGWSDGRGRGDLGNNRSAMNLSSSRGGMDLRGGRSRRDVGGLDSARRGGGRGAHGIIIAAGRFGRAIKSTRLGCGADLVAVVVPDVVLEGTIEAVSEKA